MRGEVVAGREAEPRIAPIIREMQSNTQVANSRPSGAHRVLSPSGEVLSSPLSSPLLRQTHPLSLPRHFSCPFIRETVRTVCGRHTRRNMVT